MKSFKRYFCFAVTLILVLIAFPDNYVSADSDMRYGKTVLNKMENSDSLIKIYDELVTNCADVEKSIKIKLNSNALSGEEVQTAYAMFYSDYPEYYWLQNGMSFSISSGGTVTIEPLLLMTKKEVNKTKSTFNAKVSDLLKDVSGKSDYEKSKILHDRLCDAVNYTAATHDQTAYGALVEGKAVCNGYARAYQLLMQKAGIPAWYLHGNSIEPYSAASTYVSHAWNMVKLDGSWYFTDVTWDDQGDNIFYTYFNVTTAQNENDHILSPEIEDYVPQATATEANYFVKENKVFDSFDLSRITELLKANNNEVQIYISGNFDDFFSDYDNSLNDIAASLNLNGVFFERAMLGKGAILRITDKNETDTTPSQNNQPQTDMDYQNSTVTDLTDNTDDEPTDYMIYIYIGLAALAVIIIIFFIIVKVC